jgi:hypothetical protein
MCVTSRLNKSTKDIEASPHRVSASRFHAGVMLAKRFSEHCEIAS